MHPRIIAAVCDRPYFPGLQALINSVYAYHPELPIFVFERGLHTEELSWLSKHPARIEVRSVSRFPYPCPGMWEAKQQVHAECIPHAASVCLIDVDIVLLSRIDDVFESSEDGRIVVGRDGVEIYFDTEYQVYSPKLVGQKWDQLNTGFVCFDVRRHWDLAGLWAFSANYGGYTPHGGYPLGFPGLGDQGLFDGVLALLNKEDVTQRLPLHMWHDFRAPGHLKILEKREDGQLVVENQLVHERQRFVHGVGYKWWLPNADSFHTPDDKLACFRHFAGLRWDDVEAKNGKLKTNGHTRGANGASHSLRQPVDLRALMVIHCTEELEKREQVEACLNHWRSHHPQMPGILISDGAETWHQEVAEAFKLEYHDGIRCRSIEFGALWLNRYLTLALAAAERTDCELIWKIHPDTLVQRPFEAEPPDADWFGHIHNPDAPHVHGGSSFIRVDAARRILERVRDCREFADASRWLPETLNPDIKRWARRSGWVSAEYMIVAIQKELGLRTAAWPEVHSACGLTPLPENQRRFAVLHPVKLPKRW